jgi:flavin-dependent dehydrogenase
MERSHLRFDAVEGTTWDAIIVGAGPAGALAARQLAIAGARILLVERKSFPRWKICGACLNGQALAVLDLAGLGSLVARLGGMELNEFQLGFRGRTTRLALPAGAALSRERFDNALVEAATDSGAQFLPKVLARVDAALDATRLVRLEQRGRTITASARVVLVAAGLGNHCLPPHAAPRTWIAPGSRFGAGCFLHDAPDFYHFGTIFMAVGRSGYVGLVRVEDASLNVAAAFTPELVRSLGTPGRAAARILDEAGFPPLSALESADWQGTPQLTRGTWPLAEDRLFLLGDAAGYIEPFTGEGIAWALASGQAIVPLALRAIESWEPSLGLAWSDLHRQLVRRQQLVCRALTTALRHPWLAPFVFDVFRWVPAAAGLLLRRLNAPPSFPKAS